MVREANITIEQVAAAADNIKANGGKPTARKVREVLGTGSMTTILVFFRHWKAGQIRQSQMIDDTLDPAIGRVISDQIAAKVLAATVDANERLADSQVEIDSLIADNERQSSEIDAQDAEITELHEKKSALAGRAQQLEIDIARTIAELVAERQTAEIARVGLAKAELRLEAVTKIEAEIEKIRAELMLARARAADLHEIAAVATAQREVEVEQRKIADALLMEAIRKAQEDAKKSCEEDCRVAWSTG